MQWRALENQALIDSWADEGRLLCVCRCFGLGPFWMVCLYTLWLGEAMEQEMLWVNGVVTQREGGRGDIISNCLAPLLPCDEQDKSLVTLICPHCHYKTHRHLNNNERTSLYTHTHSSEDTKLHLIISQDSLLNWNIIHKNHSHCCLLVPRNRVGEWNEGFPIHVHLPLLPSAGKKITSHWDQKFSGKGTKKKWNAMENNQ